MAGRRARTSDADVQQEASPKPGRAEARRAQQRSRRGKKGGKKKIVVWATVGTLGLIAATGGAIYWKLNGNIHSFGADGLSPDRPAAATPDANGNTPVNVLLIGSDSRGGTNKDLGGGGDAGARSDTTILLHVYADHKHAIGISIPRDSLVDIPPCKLPDGKWTKQQTSVMFNSAFAVGNTDQGNPACTQNTVEKLTNIRVDHTIVVNFQGFADMTSAVGGVDVCLPKDLYAGDLDPNLGHKGNLIFKKGPQTVSGQQALDYVRVRHGIGDGSDIGRTKRQQAFLSSLIKKVKGQGMDPTTLLPLANAATKSLIVDPGLDSAAKLMGFALDMKNIDLHNIKFITAPWRYDGARVALQHPDVDQLWASLKADRTLDGQDASGTAAGGAPASAASAPAQPGTPAAPAVDGTGIRVGVYNGTTTAGLTTKAAASLKDAHFEVTGTANASSRDHATTVVEYGPGEKSKAESVAALFPGATVESSTKAGLSLILGKDYAGGAGTAGTPAAPSAAPSVPADVAQGARSADDDPCSNLSYG